MRILPALAISLLLAGPAIAAEAVTYRGTLGKLPIIVELAEPGPEGKFAGRYAYLAKGGDIPLHGAIGADGAFSLGEEAPCTEALCKSADGQNVGKAPIAANWMLTSSEAGRRLSGEWKDLKSGKPLPLELERVGSRTLPDGYEGFDALDPTMVLLGDEEAVPAAGDFPYDFLKLDRPRKQGSVERLGEATFRLDEDARTGLAYPTVVTLPGGDPAAANDYLNRQRLNFSLGAFYCMSKAYLGFGWSGSGGEGTPGYEGGASVQMQLLTPRLIGLTETGSYYCGGAHPDNFMTYRLADATTGQTVDPESLLRGWVARDAEGKVVDPTRAQDRHSLTFGPDEELIKFVNDRRSRSDATYESECSPGDLVRTNLGVYFTQQEMVFTFKDLPHVIFACTDDLVRMPLSEARPFLTKAGLRYLGLDG